VPLLIHVTFRAVQRTPLLFQIAHPPRPRFRFRINDETCMPDDRRLASDALPSSSIEKHCMLPPTCCTGVSSCFHVIAHPHKYTSILDHHPTRFLARRSPVHHPGGPKLLTGARTATRKDRPLIFRGLLSFGDADMRLFRKIGSKYGPFDIVMVPI
jgi:hypothetical protein